MFTTEPLWLGPPSRPLAGWLTRPDSGRTASGVLILPSIGYEYWSTHRTVRVLAESLATAGYTALRLDYDGTGDSAGTSWDPNRLQAWRDSADAGAAALRDVGVERVCVLGVQFGGLLALLGAGGPADGVAVWNPVLSGRRYVRGLSMLATAVPGAEHEGGLVYAGVPFSAQTLADIAHVDISQVENSPADRVLVVARPEGPCDKLVKSLRIAGAQVESTVLTGSEIAFDVPSEDALVPTAIIESIVSWISSAVPADPGTAGSGRPDAPAALVDRPSDGMGQVAIADFGRRATMSWQTGELAEQVIRLGEHQLVAVLGTPLSGLPRTVMVFLNSGSEPHIGPGRSWVDYARTLNLAGIATVRLDFSGWGESPDLGHAPGRPYDAHTVGETAEVVRELRNSGYETVILVGLCAGAWVAMESARTTDVDGVVAINPQLYWRPGDPVEALLSDTRVRRTADRLRDKRGGRWGLWSALDAFGVRHRAATWLDALRCRGNPVLMMFAEADDGLEFLQDRCSRALKRVTDSKVIRLVEVPEIDHQMHREWARGQVSEHLVEFARGLSSERVDPVDGTAPPANRTTRSL